MTRTLKYMLTIGTTLLTVLFIATMRGAKTELASTASSVYVLSPDAGFTTIDLSAQRVIASGQFAELHSVDRVYPNPFGDSLFLQSPNLGDTTASQPTEQIAIVTSLPSGAEPSLRFARWIHGPTASSNVVWAKAVSKSLLLVSWQDEQGHITTVLYDAMKNESQHVIENFLITPTTCLGSDDQTIYSVFNSPKHEIKALNLKSLQIKESSYDSIGSPAAFYKAPVASDGCTLVFIERMAKLTSDSSRATLYIHDVEKNTTLSKFNIEGEGRFILVSNRKLLLLDQTALIPNKLPDGTTVGLRWVTTGNVFVYDVASGKQIAQISVPKDGELAGVSSDGSSAYYLSAKLLTVIDLAERRVTARVDLPFQHGIFAAGP